MHDQSQYQVRFGWGVDGAAQVGADVDVIVVVDVLDTDGHGGDGSARRTARELPNGAAIVAGSLRNRTAVAEWVLERQAGKGDRVAVAVIAAGDSRGDGIRFAVEDQFGAGAIIDALAAVGIDYCSPEAAAACASFTALRTGIGHLISASANGRRLLEQGRSQEVHLAAELDVSGDVPVVKEQAFLGPVIE